MGINRGKQFEDTLRDQFKKIPDTLCLRLYDITMGYKEINNPCDLIVFRQGTLDLFECKAIHGNTLNFKSHIRKNQWEGLLENAYIPAVNAGIIVWFMDWDITLYIDIQTLKQMKDAGYKSFNIKKDLNKVEKVYIDGTKKRVFFDYDLSTFLDAIDYF